MEKVHVKTGDTVMIISGKDRRNSCKVLQVSPKEGKATRVGHAVKDGKKVRVCKKCGAEF